LRLRGSKKSTDYIRRLLANHPPILGQLMPDKDSQKSKRVVDAMLKMYKIDIQKLKDAYNNK
jgi:hypothetical protein